MKKDDQNISFYDKLGDLLNETLEAGHVNFIRIEKEDDACQAAPEADDSKQESSSEFQQSRSQNQSNSFEKGSGNQNSSASSSKQLVYKKITPQIQRAYRLLGISPSANLEELKKAYKEKIKYYHPDKYQNNPIMAKVAGDKTHQVIEAYALLSDFIGS